MNFHKRIEKKMKEKNWEDNYIDKTLQILRSAKEKKHPYLKILDNLLLFFALIFTITGNFVISITLTPMILIMPIKIVILTAMILGLCFGLLIDIFIRDIDHINHKHYIIGGIFLPAIAIINIFIVSNILLEITKIENLKSLFPKVNFLGINFVISFYIISFLIPHFMYKIKEQMEKNV